MQETLEIIKNLKVQFPEAISAENVFLDEITIGIQKSYIKQILALLQKNYGFEVLIDLTGVDYLVPAPRTKVIYWLHNPLTYQRIRVYTYAERGEEIPSVVDLWEGADWYERELYDLFGVAISGHPNLTRILMPDDWSGHPLRKDYALTEESVQFKHDVKPKIPSEIIPHVQDNYKR